MNGRFYSETLVGAFYFTHLLHFMKVNGENTTKSIEPNPNNNSSNNGNINHNVF